MKRFVVAAVLLCLVLGMTGCSVIESYLPSFLQFGSSNDQESRIVGVWEMEEMEIGFQFSSDHTGKTFSLTDDQEVTFRWSYDADADVYPIYVSGKAYVYYFVFTEDGNLSYNGVEGTKVE